LWTDCLRESEIPFPIYWLQILWTFHNNYQEPLSSYTPPYISLENPRTLKDYQLRSYIYVCAYSYIYVCAYSYIYVCAYSYIYVCAYFQLSNKISTKQCRLEARAQIHNVKQSLLRSNKTCCRLDQFGHDTQVACALICPLDLRSGI
jgi:hypothetical protein